MSQSHRRQWWFGQGTSDTYTTLDRSREDAMEQWLRRSTKGKMWPMKDLQVDTAEASEDAQISLLESKSHMSKQQKKRRRKKQQQAKKKAQEQAKESQPSAQASDEDLDAPASQHSLIERQSSEQNPVKVDHPIANIDPSNEQSSSYLYDIFVKSDCEKRTKILQELLEHSKTSAAAGEKLFSKLGDNPPAYRGAMRTYYSDLWTRLAKNAAYLDQMVDYSVSRPEEYREAYLNLPESYQDKLSKSAKSNLPSADKTPHEMMPLLVLEAHLDQVGLSHQFMRTLLIGGDERKKEIAEMTSSFQALQKAAGSCQSSVEKFFGTDSQSGSAVDVVDGKTIISESARSQIRKELNSFSDLYQDHVDLMRDESQGDSRLEFLFSFALRGAEEPTFGDNMAVGKGLRTDMWKLHNALEKNDIEYLQEVATKADSEESCSCERCKLVIAR